MPDTLSYFSILEKYPLYPLLTFLSFAVYCVGLVVYRLCLSPLSTIPGPKLAAATSWWILYHDYKNKRTDTITNLHRRYGPTVRIGPNEVSFTSATAVKDIYSGASRESGFPKGFLYALFTHYGKYNMFSSLTSEEHSWRRRMFASSYSLTNIINRESKHGHIWKTVGDYLNYIRKDGYRDGNTPSYAVDIYPANIYYACDNITGHIFGGELATKALGSRIDNAQSGQQRDALDDWYIPTRRELIYLWTDFNTPLRYFDNCEWIVHKIVNFVQQRRDPDVEYAGGTFIHHYAYTALLSSKTSPVTEPTVAEKLLSEKKSDRVPRDFDEFGAASETMDHILAGMDTTGDTLSFLLFLLSLPEHHAYQDVIRDNLPEMPPFGQPPSVATITQIMTNPYVNSAIKETLLIFPAIPVTLPRVVPSGGRVIDGFRLPEGTLASSSVYAVNQSLLPGFEKNISSSKWTPSRWLIESDADRDRVQELERRLWSFGSGGRGCIGKHLALVEMSLLLAAILSHFRLRQTDDCPIEIKHSNWTARRSFRDLAYMDEFNGIIRFEAFKE
ncbi:hypothetical protein TWF694_009795 [Orbilia ellipsospora]|uniref:Cytochrome P450 n=1 Tax=Orbilia ellipsospora TaxID=2528407 RepID=A0AAV9XBX9_9PEZI